MDALHKLLKKNKALKYLQYDSMNTMALKREWCDLAGKILSESLSVSFIRGKLLELETTNPCWIQEIEYYKKPLLKKINNHFNLKIQIEWIKIIVKS